MCIRDRWYVYDKVTMTLDAQTVADYMQKCHLLKHSQLESILSKREEPTNANAAEDLLNTVIEPFCGCCCGICVFNCFLNALQRTGHQHVYDLIETGDITGSYETNVLSRDNSWP